MKTADDTLGHLADHGYDLTGSCQTMGCPNLKKFMLSELIKRYGRNEVYLGRLSEIARPLRCHKCEKRNVVLTISSENAGRPQRRHSERSGQ